jgi:hypothetical protein
MSKLTDEILEDAESMAVTALANSGNLETALESLSYSCSVLVSPEKTGIEQIDEMNAADKVRAITILQLAMFALPDFIVLAPPEKD